jgi:hypothetical protein
VVTGREWQDAQAIDPGESVLTADGDLLPVQGIDWATQAGGVAYNLTVADLHTYFVVVGDAEVLVHNTCDLRTVGEVLKSKKGSIKNAKLDKGSPSWNEIGQMTMDQIQANAKANMPGFKTIWKLLRDKRFDK